MTLLDYFREVYTSHIVESLVPLTRGLRRGYVHSFPGMTVVLAVFPLAVCLLDLAVKLSASFGIAPHM